MKISFQNCKVKTGLHPVAKSEGLTPENDKGLAQLNQCRLNDNTALKPQSVVWLTDAPLLTNPGIDSATWVETPANSPFRLADSAESQERQSWLEALPIKEKSKTITTDDNRTYRLSVVDLAPTV